MTININRKNSLFLFGFPLNLIVVVLVPALYGQQFAEHNSLSAWFVFCALFTIVLWYSSFKKMLQDVKFINNSSLVELRGLRYDEYLKENEVPLHLMLEDSKGNKYLSTRMIKSDIQDQKYQCYVKGNKALISDYSLVKSKS